MLDGGGVEEDSGVMRVRRGVVVGKGAGLGSQRFGAAPVGTEHSSMILFYLLICWNGAASRHDEINPPSPPPPQPPSLSLSVLRIVSHSFLRASQSKRVRAL